MLQQKRRSLSVLQHLLLFQISIFIPTLFPSIDHKENAIKNLVLAFQYKLDALELSAPEMLCFSGDATPATTTGPQFACPTPDNLESYPAVVMDEGGYVKINVKDIRLRDDGRRRNGQLSNKKGKRNLGHYYHQLPPKIQQMNLSQKNYGDLHVSPYTRHLSQKNDSDVTDVNDIEPSSENEVIQEASIYPHHLQVYLVSLENFSVSILRNQCCYELETAPPDWIEKTSEGKVILPEECKYNPTNNEKKKAGSISNSMIASFSHDYRVNAARIRPLGYTSTPIELNVPSDEAGINIMTTLRPTDMGRYIVVISNCAAELNYDQSTNTTFAKGLKMVISGMDITFVSKFGELPLSMMGIIPFYGIMTTLYLLLSLIWIRQSRGGKSKWWKRRGNTSSAKNDQYTPMTLLGLQSAIRLLVFCQTGFSALAFSYYLYLNGTSVDVNVLYSGVAAALVNWGPWSIAVALAHFGTLWGCQVVVTLATDGMWLIQNNAHDSTKKALYVMGIIWGLYFTAYGFLTVIQRRVLYLCFGLVWILFLMLNVRRSLRHLKSLMIGQSTDQIMAVGGAIVAKRSMYRKMCVVVSVYPIIFASSFIWTVHSNVDSWAWVGYVLVDIYLFIILLHASITWMPRPMASQEFLKYAPLELNAVDNDLDLWEETMDGEMFEEEIELESIDGKLT